MVFIITFLIATVIGWLLAEGINKISGDDIERWKREDENE